jgi:hypothetical protein
LIQPLKLALSSIIVLGAACRSQREVDERHSAARVTRAIEVLREAPNAAKAQPLANLAKLPCAGSDVCKTRDACSAAYAMHVEAVTLTQAAKQQLADGHASEAAKVLGAAERKLAQANLEVTTCTDLEGALRRRYKL